MRREEYWQTVHWEFVGTHGNHSLFLNEPELNFLETARNHLPSVGNYPKKKPKIKGCHVCCMTSFYGNSISISFYRREEQKMKFLSPRLFS